MLYSISIAAEIQLINRWNLNSLPFIYLSSIASNFSTECFSMSYLAITNYTILSKQMMLALGSLTYCLEGMCVHLLSLEWPLCPKLHLQISSTDPSQTIISLDITQLLIPWSPSKLPSLVTYQFLVVIAFYGTNRLMIPQRQIPLLYSRGISTQLYSAPCFTVSISESALDFGHALAPKNLS